MYTESKLYNFIWICAQIWPPFCNLENTFVICFLLIKIKIFLLDVFFFFLLKQDTWKQHKIHIIIQGLLPWFRFCCYSDLEFITRPPVHLISQRLQFLLGQLWNILGFQVQNRSIMTFQLLFMMLWWTFNFSVLRFNLMTSINGLLFHNAHTRTKSVLASNIGGDKQ